MSERERRLALNEAMFREVNERVEDMTNTFESDSGTFEILCECADAGCTERLSIPKNVYESVRSDATHFLLHAGHEDSTVERVIETHDSYIVVEKDGSDVERVVEQTDPRADLDDREADGKRRPPVLGASTNPPKPARARRRGSRASTRPVRATSCHGRGSGR